jgi:integrase/recombinase XerC
MSLEFFFVSDFSDHLLNERRLSPHTCKAYITDIRAFVEVVQAEGLSQPDQIELAHIRFWVSSMVEAGVSARTVHRKLSALRTWFDYLKEHRKAIAVSPAERITAPKRGRNIVEVNDKAALTRLIMQFQEGNESTQIRLLPVVVLYLTGMRVSELIGLRRNDWESASSQLRITGKGGKQRLVPVHSGLVPYLNKYCTTTDQATAALFTDAEGKPYYARQLHRLVKSVMSELGARGRLSPHTLRHSFATHVLDEGAELLAVKEILGHSNLSATQVYTRNSLEKLRKLHKLLHPRSE